jgi:hypothetical protein
MIKVRVIVKGYDYHIRYDSIKVSKFNIDSLKAAYPFDVNMNLKTDTPNDVIIFTGSSYDIFFIKQMHIKG